METKYKKIKEGPQFDFRWTLRDKSFPREKRNIMRDKAIVVNILQLVKT